MTQVSYIWNVLDTDGSQRLTYEEFHSGVTDKPLLLAFLNRWFVDPILLRQENLVQLGESKGGARAKSMSVDACRTNWDLQVAQIGRLDEDVDNELLLDLNKIFAENSFQEDVDTETVLHTKKNSRPGLHKLARPRPGHAFAALGKWKAARSRRVAQHGSVYAKALSECLELA
ncbi:hypothetical protein CYMTET_10905 [Cymbomonas tetramitiformis]|uniref:EF-hand domain-containing protein n=1 Tax=Cymbomonas tetramitiformis TaxID=36881 RepID=A0AAE0LDI7_9CHLO|nr:hypothetical protein CYMTET_10905 [Cymbomonas tetramitiformis]